MNQPWGFGFRVEKTLWTPELLLEFALMRRAARVFDLLGQTILGLFLRFSVMMGILLSGAPLAGQTSSLITNLAQLTQVGAGQQQAIASLQLSAVVFACDTNSGALVLADASGAELLELDGLDTEFRPGDQVEISGKQLLVCSSDVGIFVSAAPLLNNDGAHPPKTVNGEFWLAAGRHAVRLDWFNQVALEELSVGCAPARSEGVKNGGFSPESNLLHAVSAECYEGFWTRLPNYQLLRPVKVASVTNFDIHCQTRPEMAGIRFFGFIDVPADGNYAFQLRSDDGSRLWIGNTAAPVRKIGTGAPPAAPQAMQTNDAGAATGKDARRLATIVGRVGFATRSGKGMRLDALTDQGAVRVVVANSGSLEPAELLNVTVRVSGVAGGIIAASQRPVLGSLSAVSWKDLTVIEPAPDNGQPSWRTLRRLLSVVGILLIILVFVSIWTAVLRRQVAQRTRRLHEEIRVRENAERERAIEAERARIARDLHDELGSGLTEMGLLASAGLEEQKALRQTGERYHKIAERARALVAGLDVIVWAIDPRQNSLQSLADYIEHYAEELLATSGIHCRFKIPFECKAAFLTGPARHSLLLAIKEALSNVIRHSAATEVELRLAQSDDRLEICIADNGRGFDLQSIRWGDGLKNIQERMKPLGGQCAIESAVGKGTTIRLTVWLGADNADGAQRGIHA